MRATDDTGLAALGFSVILPVFDEEGGVLTTLDALERALRGSTRPYEIIVVDDGSRDATARLLATCEDARVRVIRHEENRGYGAALKSGIRAARHPLVVVMDADGTYAASAIPALVGGCDDADMVVGARIGASVHATPARTTVKWFFRQFAQSITGARIPDLNSGLRAFRPAVAERFMDVLPDGFSFTTTITVGSLLEGLAVRFDAVDYMPRIGRSKLHPVRDTLRIARQLLRLGWRFAPLRTSAWLAAPWMLAFVVSSSWHLADMTGVTLGDCACGAAGLAVIAIGARAEERVRRRRRPPSAGIAERSA